DLACEHREQGYGESPCAESWRWEYRCIYVMHVTKCKEYNHELRTCRLRQRGGAEGPSCQPDAVPLLRGSPRERGRGRHLVALRRRYLPRDRRGARLPAAPQYRQLLRLDGHRHPRDD